jgi:hypothetical protein
MMLRVRHAAFYQQEARLGKPRAKRIQRAGAFHRRVRLRYFVTRYQARLATVAILCGK